MRTSRYLLGLVLVLAGLLGQSSHAQLTNILFLDDFSGTEIDTNRYTFETPFFEGGKGTFNYALTDGTLEITGVVDEQWWPGATLEIKERFTVSPETNVVVTVDRVAEQGVGSASRSALWIMDSTKTYYVLFADVRAEGGWRFNRKIGISGDNPTGSGTDIAQFNPAAFDDSGPHRMKMVADGANVRLYLDDVAGPNVRFPFSKDLVVQVGSFARANFDTAHTIFDNLKVESVGKATFVITNANLTVGEIAQNYQVRIPPGLNATSNVTVRVASSSTNVAIPVGADAQGRLTLTFAAGGSNVQNFAIEAKAIGGATFTIQNDFALGVGNTLPVVVILGPGTRLSENFSSALDPSRFTNNPAGFEVGAGEYQVAAANGQLTISGFTTSEFWGGASAKTVSDFTATKDLNLQVEVTRVSMEPLAVAARSGVFLTTADRSRYVWFGQNYGETGWQVNVNPGNPTGSGTAIAAFSELQDLDSHRIKFIANGQTVDIFLDDIYAGTFDFAATTGIHVELGAYGRSIDDTVTATFDNLEIKHVLPCIAPLTRDISTPLGESIQPVGVVIPKLLNGSSTVTLNILSSDPAVANAVGAQNGRITLAYPPGTQTNYFTIQGQGVGVARFTIEAPAGADVCVAGDVAVTVTPPLQILLADDFAGAAVDLTKWIQDDRAFDDLGGGYVFDNSGLSITNGAVKIAVTAEFGTWPGISLMTMDSFTAEATRPVSFEIDRTVQEFQLVTGTAAKQRSSFWVSDESRSQYVVLSDYATHDGTAGGWQYHRFVNQVGDTPTTGAGVFIPAFAEPRFNDKRNHRVKMSVNGATVKLFLDGVPGPEIPFPVASGIKFGFGAYVAAATDITSSTFDNARVTGTSSGPLPTRLTVAREGNDLVITWTGAGTLQRASTLVGPNNWTDIPNVPPGTTYRTATSDARQFFRLRQ